MAIYRKNLPTLTLTRRQCFLDSLMILSWLSLKLFIFLSFSREDLDSTGLGWGTGMDLYFNQISRALECAFKFEKQCKRHVPFTWTLALLERMELSPETLMNILDIHTQSTKLVTCHSCVSHLIRGAAVGGVSACPRGGHADSVGWTPTFCLGFPFDPHSNPLGVLSSWYRWWCGAQHIFITCIGHTASWRSAGGWN